MANPVVRPKKSKIPKSVAIPIGRDAGIVIVVFIWGLPIESFDYSMISLSGLLSLAVQITGLLH